MIHLGAALFFTVALLVAAVSIHLMVQLYWTDILQALRGELGVSGPSSRVTPAYARPRRRAAA